LDLEKTFAGVRPLADTLWSRLSVLRATFERPRILFTSTQAESGTTLMTAATALGLARNLRRDVRVVETRFERPGMADYFEIPRGPGLSDVLDHRATLDQSLQRLASCPDLGIIPAGSPRAVIPGEFATGEVCDLLGSISGGADFTLFDAAPIQSDVETRMLLEHVDGVVFVVRARSAHTKALRESADIVERAGLPVFGCVLNRYKSDVPFGLE
jgi:succinoglycan biosynthesis transport protein ExoP